MLPAIHYTLFFSRLPPAHSRYNPKDLQLQLARSAYTVPFKFTGKIGKIKIELKPITTASAIEAEKERTLAASKPDLSQ